MSCQRWFLNFLVCLCVNADGLLPLGVLVHLGAGVGVGRVGPGSVVQGQSLVETLAVLQGRDI